jgi:drug/metabolite transporter (DMT)-like permease
VLALQQLTALALAFTALYFTWTGDQIASLQAASMRGWSFAIISGVFQYAIAFSLYLAAMRSISIGLVGAFLNLIPIFGLLGAFALLRETMTPTQLGASALTILSLFALTRTEHKKVFARVFKQPAADSSNR